MSINSEQAYLRSKASYGGAWKGKLPRNCGPSDCDFWFDNHGRILFCELEIAINSWEQMEGAQLSVYQSAIRHGEHCAVLCHHNISENRIIDNLADVVSFQAMVWHWQSFRVSRIIEGNNHWQNFVIAWYRNPDGLRGNIIEHSNIINRSWLK